MQSYPTLGRWLAGAATAAVFAAVLLLMMGSSRSDDPDKTPKQIQSGTDSWVMYGGDPSRNMVNAKVKNLPAEWDIDPKEPVNIKWSADLGSKSYGGPVVVGGKVFVGTNNQHPREQFLLKGDKKIPLVVVDAKGKPVLDKKGKMQAIDLGVLMCFDEKNGKFAWQQVFFKLDAGQVQDWPQEGLCSTPVVEGDRLYYVSNRCEVVCQDMTGKIHWKLDMIGKLGVFPHNLAACSPLLVGDDLWVVTSNGVTEDHITVPAPPAPSFIRLDKKTGDVTWKNNMPTAKLLEAGKEEITKNFLKTLVNRGELIQHGQWSNPSYGVVDGQAQVIFPGGDGWIYSFDPKTTKLLWKFDCNPKDAKYELGAKGTRSDFIASPVVYKNRVYIGTGQDPEHDPGVGHLWCIDMTKRGDVSPELVVNNNVWPPKTKPNPNSAMVWHYGGPVAAKDKGKIDRNYYFGRTMSTCAIHDDLVYAAELAGYLHCLDAKTGEVYWSHSERAATWCSPYWADGKIYLGYDDSTVRVFAHGKTKKLLGENDMGRKVRATPVAANGTLYVMTENRLYAIAKKGD